MTNVVKLENVRIGVSGGSGFCMTPFINGLSNHFTADKCEGYDGSKIEILGYSIPEDDEELVNMFSSQENVFVAQSFSNDYILAMQRLYSLSSYLLNLNETKRGKGCSISELAIFTRLAGKEIYFPPIDTLNIYGVGNISNHPYVKSAFWHTSRIKSFYPQENLLYSKKGREYNILSLSAEYKSFLQESVSELAKILDIYAK